MLPRRVDVWKVEMDLMSSEASDRQREVLQPLGSFPQPASPRLCWWSLAGVYQHCLPLPSHSLGELFLLWQVLSLWPQVTPCNTTSPVCQHWDAQGTERVMFSTSSVLPSTPTPMAETHHTVWHRNRVSVLSPVLVWVSVLGEKSDL